MSKDKQIEVIQIAASKTNRYNKTGINKDSG